MRNWITILLVIWGFTANIKHVISCASPKPVSITYNSISELTESLQPKLPAGFQEPVMIAESVHVQFRVSKFEVIESGGCRDCEAFPRLLMAEAKGKAPEFSAVIINEAAIAMDRLDVQPNGRDVRLTGKLTVYPASKESPQGRYELYVENVRDLCLVRKKEPVLRE
ncbi:single stranded DNA-binding domain-containing protein [Lacunimicrobium album]